MAPKIFLDPGFQGGGKRLPNYRLVGENSVLVGENLFDALCRLKFASSVYQ